MRRPILRGLLAAVLACALTTSAVPPPASADSGFVSAVEKAIDDTGVLPLKFSDIDTVLESCGGDDPIACADQVASNPALAGALSGDIQRMFAILFDIERKDYWGLIEDAGKEAACGAAKIMTGVDVCGLLDDIAAVAQEVVSDAEAVAQFLADLGEDIAQAIQDIGCFFGIGCSSSSPPPPPSPAQMAAGYYASVLAQGLSVREQSPAAWGAYAGQGQSSTVIDNAPGGIPRAALTAALPKYVSDVYAAWDADITAHYVLKTRGFEQTFAQPSTVSAYVGQGLAAGASVDLSQATLSYANGLSAFVTPGQTGCANAYAGAGARLVRDWITENRPQASGLTAPPDPNATCPAFYQALTAGLNQALRGKMFASLGGACPAKGAGAAPYVCGNAYQASRCNAVTTLLDNAKECVSAVNGPGKIPYNCGGQIKTYVIGTQPAYCHPAQVNAPPPRPMGGFRLQ